jgi:hypothetical protein
LEKGVRDRGGPGLPDIPALLGGRAQHGALEREERPDMGQRDLRAVRVGCQRLVEIASRVRLIRCSG